MSEICPKCDEKTYTAATGCTNCDLLPEQVDEFQRRMKTVAHAQTSVEELVHHGIEQDAEITRLKGEVNDVQALCDRLMCASNNDAEKRMELEGLLSDVIQNVEAGGLVLKETLAQIRKALEGKKP